MLDEVRQALEIGPSATIEERTIDITTIGRRSGQPRRIEICFYRFEDSIYLSGVPSPRTRDWLNNLAENPQFVFHLKARVSADLTATATVITDSNERRRVLSAFVDEFNLRNREGSSWPRAEVDAWVDASPLARVAFVESL